MLSSSLGNANQMLARLIQTPHRKTKEDFSVCYCFEHRDPVNNHYKGSV